VRRRSGETSGGKTSRESEPGMAKIVRVTPAQVSAARLKVKRAVAAGKFVSPGVNAVANARRLTNRGQPAPGS